MLAAMLAECMRVTRVMYYWLSQQAASQSESVSSIASCQHWARASVIPVPATAKREH
jgi:hypothetical protein